MKKNQIALVSIVGLLFLLPNHAQAHARVSDSFPSVNATVTVLPKQVWIEFDGSLTQIDGYDVNSIEVRDSQGNVISIGKSVVAGARINRQLADQAMSGKILVKYRVVSEDGHPVEGEYEFNLVDQGSQTNSQDKTTKKESSAKNPVKTTSPKASQGSGSSTPSELTQVQSNSHSHESVYDQHKHHIFQFSIVGVAILAWFMFERRKKRLRD